MQSRIVYTLLGLAALCLPLRAEDFIVVGTPEPTSIVMFVTGFGGLLLLHRKYRKKG